MRANETQGQTLLEIVISMFLLAAVIALLCQVIPLSRSYNRKLETRFGLAFQAQAAMEEMLTVPAQNWSSKSWQLEGGYHFRAETVALKENKLYRGAVIISSGGQEVYRLETYLLP